MPSAQVMSIHQALKTTEVVVFWLTTAMVLVVVRMLGLKEMTGGGVEEVASIKEKTPT